MALVTKNFVKAHGYASQATEEAHLFKYKTTADALAVANAAGYFNGVATYLNVGDAVLLAASDDTAMYKVTVVTPNVTLVAL